MSPGALLWRLACRSPWRWPRRAVRAGRLRWARSRASAPLARRWRAGRAWAQLAPARWVWPGVAVRMVAALALFAVAAAVACSLGACPLAVLGFGLVWFVSGG